MFRIKPSAPVMTQEQIIKTFIQEFESSSTRRNMLVGERYYDNENDINNRRLYKYIDGSKVEDIERPNNKLSHSFAKLLVDEKVNYLLGKSPIIAAEDKDFQKKLIDILNYKFDDTINEVGVESSNKGIAWLQPYIDENGYLEFKQHDSEQIIGIFKDKARTKLESVIRFYYVETYEGQNKLDIRKVEYWTEDTVMYYTEYNGNLIPDIEANEAGEPIGHFILNNKYHGWGKVPFIPFKNNSREKNDLTYFKSLIDDYDKNTSDTSNTLDDIARFIYILKNYGGSDLEEFLNDLKLYKVVKVDDDGGVDKLSPDINVDAVEKHLDRIKKDIYIFGQGVDMDTDRFGASPSGIALKFLYSSLDLKCDQMERKFKKAFEELFWFIAEYLKITGKGIFDYKTAKVRFVINNSMNVSDSINDCKNSLGIVSNKTILENHPWVSDVTEEEERLEEQNEEDGLHRDIIPVPNKEDGEVDEE